MHTDQIEARDSPIHGSGVFAIRKISKDTRIIEYTGRRVRWDSCEPNDDSHTELFSVSDDHVLDPKEGGSDARYINHSCKPNCIAVMEGERVFIESLRKIKPGEELFYDYGLQLGDKPTKKAVRDHLCRCGNKKCRGTMLAVPKSLRKKVRKWAFGK